MKIKINEISSSEFRTKLKQLGFAEKGQELTSGGEMNSTFLDILVNLMNDWKKMSGVSCALTITSGNDKFHQNRKSRHKTGEAVDIGVSQSCHSQFIKLLDTYRTKYNGFSYINEYLNPSKGSTGGHFHISYRSGQPEGGKGVSSSEYSASDENGSLSATTATFDDSAAKKMVTQMFGLSDLEKGLKASFMKEDKLQEEIQRIKKLL